MTYIPIEELLTLIPNNYYNKGAVDMLKFIANKQGLKESETHIFIEFYKDII